MRPPHDAKSFTLFHANRGRVLPAGGGRQLADWAATFLTRRKTSPGGVRISVPPLASLESAQDVCLTRDVPCDTIHQEGVGSYVLYEGAPFLRHGVEKRLGFGKPRLTAPKNWNRVLTWRENEVSPKTIDNANRRKSANLSSLFLAFSAAVQHSRPGRGSAQAPPGGVRVRLRFLRSPAVFSYCCDICLWFSFSSSCVSRFWGSFFYEGPRWCLWSSWSWFQRGRYLSPCRCSLVFFNDFSIDFFVDVSSINNQSSFVANCGVYFWQLSAAFISVSLHMWGPSYATCRTWWPVGLSRFFPRCWRIWFRGAGLISSLVGVRNVCRNVCLLDKFAEKLEPRADLEGERGTWLVAHAELRGAARFG